MRRVCATFLIRLTASSLILGLLLAVLSGNAQAADRGSDYSSWFRLHLPGNIPDTVREALEHADTVGAHTLDAFLKVFLEELDRTGSQQETTEWLYGKSVDAVVLRNDLRLRLLGADSNVVLQRSFESIAVSQIPAAKKRVNQRRVVRTAIVTRSLMYGRHLGAAERALQGITRYRVASNISSETHSQGP